ncbi:hypothetical protein Emag_004033 [Eimeria magna]
MGVAGLTQDDGEGSEAQTQSDKEDAQAAESASSLPVAAPEPHSWAGEEGPPSGHLRSFESREKAFNQVSSTVYRTQDESTHASASSLPLPVGLIAAAKASGWGPWSVGSTLGPRAAQRKSSFKGCPPDFEQSFKTTIQHMDHRRLQRQLNGVRKKDPQKRVLLMTFFCLFLLAWNSAYVDTSSECWKVGFIIRFAGLKGPSAIGAVNSKHSSPHTLTFLSRVLKAQGLKIRV